jgi:hypothetical protein
LRIIGLELAWPPMAVDSTTTTLSPSDAPVHRGGEPCRPGADHGDVDALVADRGLDAEGYRHVGL